MTHTNARKPTPQHTIALRLLRADAPGTIMGAPEDWPRWAILLPHVLAALDHIECYDDTTSEMMSSLLDRAGTYLHVHGRTREAAPLLERALAIDEDSHGPDHPDVAIRLNNLAQILRALGQPARPLVERALAITEASHGPDHPNVANHLSNLVLILLGLGEPVTARPLAERALAITEASYGPDHPTSPST